MISCEADYLWWLLQGAGIALSAVAFVIACVALAAHKRNRQLIRRMADEIRRSVVKT